MSDLLSTPFSSLSPLANVVFWYYLIRVLWNYISFERSRSNMMILTVPKIRNYSSDIRFYGAWRTKFWLLHYKTRLSCSIPPSKSGLSRFLEVIILRVGLVSLGHQSGLCKFSFFFDLVTHLYISFFNQQTVLFDPSFVISLFKSLNDTDCSLDHKNHKFNLTPYNLHRIGVLIKFISRLVLAKSNKDWIVIL